MIADLKGRGMEQLENTASKSQDRNFQKADVLFPRVNVGLTKPL